jgi:hypothetical protein
MALSAEDQEQFCGAVLRRKIRRAIDSQPPMGGATVAAIDHAMSTRRCVARAWRD